MFVARAGGKGSLTPGVTDVPASFDGHLVNCCDSNSSRSARLHLGVFRVYRTVRHNSVSFFSTLTAYCGRYGRPSDPVSLQGSGHIKWKGNTAPIKLAPSHPSRTEVVINRAYEQEDQTPQTSQSVSPISIERTVG